MPLKRRDRQDRWEPSDRLDWLARCDGAEPLDRWDRYNRMDRINRLNRLSRLSRMHRPEAEVE